MGEKISKTAKASMRGSKVVAVRNCPMCGEAMVATKVVNRYTTIPGGMYWICKKCDFRERVHK
jgi:predicted RNA-binding Zn-ribbon protein involved in translation (DUF1610 family)